MNSLWRSLRCFLGIGLAGTALVACSGGGGGSHSPTGSTANAPVISSPTLGFTSAACTQRDGSAGTTQVLITFRYADPDGDVIGGAVEIARVFNTGKSETTFRAVPSEGVEVSGTTSGEIRVQDCIRLEAGTNFTQTTTLLDAKGNRSNTLSGGGGFR